MKRKLAVLILSILSSFGAGLYIPSPIAKAYARPNFIGCRATQNGVQTFNLGIAYGAIPFGTNDYDTTGGSMHSTSVNTSRFTAKYSGYYFVFGNAETTGASGDKCLCVRTNGSTVWQQSTIGSAASQFIGVNGIVYLNATEYAEICILGTGGNGNTVANTNTSGGMCLIADKSGVGRTSLNSVICAFSNLSADTANTSNNTWATVAWNQNSAEFPSGLVHSTSTNKARFNAPYAGYYLCVANVYWASSAVGERRMGWGYNTAETTSPSPVYGQTTTYTNAGGDPTGTCAATVKHLAAGDYMEVYCDQNSGGNLNMIASASGASFVYLGEAP